MKERKNHPIQSFWLVGLFFCTIGMSLPGICVELRADSSLPAMAVGYQSGKITAIYESKFQIDGKTLSLIPEAEILDRHGDPLKTSDLRVDIEVKYHLLKGSTDTIDRIILFLPY